MAGVTSFLAIFIVGFGFGFSPSMPLITTVWWVVLGLGLIAGTVQFYRRKSGITDLVLDNRMSVASLPTKRLFANGPAVLFDRLLRTSIERIVRRHKNTTSISYKLRLHYLDDADVEQDATICDWSDEKDARALAEWINQRVSITTGPAGSSAGEDSEDEEEVVTA